MEIKSSDKQLSIMRWISFGVVTVLFVLAAVQSIWKGQETDRTITAVFLVILGFAWGANFWKIIIDRIIK